MRAELPTFAQVVALYLSTITALAEKTRTEHRCMLAALVKALAPRPTGVEVWAFLDGRVSRGELAPQTATLFRKVMWRAYDRARRLQWPTLLNPVEVCPRWQNSLQRPRALADDMRTVPRILAAMPDARARAFILSMRMLGLRKSEALGLEHRHVMWGKEQVRVEQQRHEDKWTGAPLKTDTSSATMPLPQMLAEALREAAQDKMRAGVCTRKSTQKRAGFLFPYTGRELTHLVSTLREVSPVDFAEGVRGSHGGNAFHVFRHAFGTSLVTKGVAVEQVQVLMRHKSIATTVGYVASIRGRVVPAAELRLVWASETEGWNVPPSQDLKGRKDNGENARKDG
jgi:integrase